MNRQGATCIACSTPVPLEFIRSEGKAGYMGNQLMAIVAEGQNSRAYLSATKEQADTAAQANPVGVPETDLPEQALGFRVQLYGMTKHRDLFTSRQLVALTSFSDLVPEARKMVLDDAARSGISVDDISLNDGGTEANAYADAIATYLTIALDKGADYWSSICSWHNGRDSIGHTFTKQTLSMIWDYAQGNPFSNSSGNFGGAIEWVAEVIAASSSNTPGEAKQRDATTTINGVNLPLISTDPPYYDNIGYADLSDFFENGLQKAFEQARTVQNPDYPLSVYYAFKQAESESDEDDGDETNKNNLQIIASTGWETMLEGLIRAGFTITGTWPVRTELSNRPRGIGSNALASSIVLVCRPREIGAPIASRREFLYTLRAELPIALKNLQRGSIAPVDLAQACIGPGISIYSRYSKVVESDGTPMSIHIALQLINRALDEALAEQEGEYDAETRWAIAWFEQYAMNAAEYGVAETLSKAKNTTVHSLVDAGLLEARSGKVRLLKREEFPQEWRLKDKSHLPAWEVMQRMIHALLSGNGESGAGDILRQVSEQAEMARDLAYRLYTVCERKGWAQEALAYNSLVTSWSEISRLAHREAEGIQQASFLA